MLESTRWSCRRERILTMPDKNETARLLANAHCESEPAIREIIRLVNDTENQSAEPIKLLEVNPATSPSGILPVVFGPDPPDVPYPSIVVEVTERELDEIRAGRLPLPNGWRLGDTLYRAAG